MSRLRRHNGLWKDAERYRKHNGVWKPVSERYRRMGGLWQQTYSSGWVLEGSWETGNEGWELSVQGMGSASRVNNGARTGSWAITLGGPQSGIGMATFTLPDSAAYVKVSVWVMALGTAALKYRLGSGAWTDFALDTGTSSSVYRQLSGIFANPNGLSASVQIHQTGGGSGMRFDDWRIESVSIPSIGGAFEGGFYAGDMEVDGVNYMHILADVADAVDLEWGGYDPVLVTNARSETDSKANTDILVNHSRTYAAAEYCRNYRGGGFEDWDLPAVQVLEMCGANFASGPQAVTGAYWSSTEASSGNAIRVAFPQFQRGNHTKGAVYTARPVRRIRIANP